MRLLTFIALLTSILLGNLCIVPVASAGPFQGVPGTEEFMSKVTEVSCRMPFSERTSLGTKARKVACPGGQCLTEKEAPDGAALAFSTMELPMGSRGSFLVPRPSSLVHFPPFVLEHPPIVRSILTVVLRV